MGGADCARSCNCRIENHVKQAGMGQGFTSKCDNAEAFDCLWRRCCKAAQPQVGKLTRVLGSECRLPALAPGRCVRKCGCELLDEDDLFENGEGDECDSSWGASA